MGLYETFHPIVFLWSLLWGVYIYLVYEALHFIRILFKDSSKLTFICDLLFMTVSAVFMFIFSLAYNFGQLRIYMLFGVILSFFILKFTVGKVITILFSKIGSGLCFVFINFLNFFKKLTNKLLKLYSILVYNLVKKKEMK